MLPPLLEEIRPNDVVLLMSYGGFDNIHERLVEALRAGHSSSTAS
jgi:UDP-N-acetylmuramate-alanine ligase